LIGTGQIDCENEQIGLLQLDLKPTFQNWAIYICDHKNKENMSEKNEKLYNLGTAICSLGGLFLILNFSSFFSQKWGLEMSVVAMVLCLVGIFMMEKAKKRDKKE